MGLRTLLAGFITISYFIESKYIPFLDLVVISFLIVQIAFYSKVRVYQLKVI